MSNFKIISAALGVLLACAMPPSAFAEPKPDPVPANSTDTAVDLTGWEKAYTDAGKPRMLLLCGIDTGQAPAADAAALGGGLDPFDEGGDAAALQASIEEVLLKNPRLRMVHLEAKADYDRREVELLRQRGQKRAIEVLASRLQADLILLVRLYPKPNDDTRYRVVLETIEVGSAEKIASFAFDWKLDDGAASIKLYGRRIAGKFIEQFVSHVGKAPDRRFKLLMVGIPDAESVKAARDAFTAIPGVKEVLDDDFSNNGRESVAGFEISFAGRPLDLLFQTQSIAREKLGLAVSGVDVASGTITLMARSQQRWQQLLDPSSSVARGAFQKSYQDAHSPRVAVIIGRQLNDKDRSQSDVAKALADLGKQPAAFPGADVPAPAPSPTPAAAHVPADPIDVGGVGSANPMAADLNTSIGKFSAALQAYDQAKANPSIAPGQIALRYQAVEQALIEMQRNMRSLRSRMLPELPGVPTAPTTGAPAARPVQPPEVTPGGRTEVMASIQTKGIDTALETLRTLTGAPQTVIGAITQPVTGVGQTMNQLQRSQDMLSGRPAPRNNGNRPRNAQRIADSRVVAVAPQRPPTTPQPAIAPAHTQQPASRNPLPPPVRQPTAVDPEFLATSLVKQLLEQKIQVLDPAQVRQSIERAAITEQKIFREDQLAALVRSQESVDVLIIGTPATGAGGATGYSFRAIRTSDGEIIAAAVWMSESVADPADALASATQYLAGNLLDQLWGSWSSPQRVTVRIENAKTLRELKAVESLMRDAIPEIVTTDLDEMNGGMQGGVASFQVTYRGDRSELLRKLEDGSREDAKGEHKLPFDLDARSFNRDVLTVHLREPF